MANMKSATFVAACLCLTAVVAGCADSTRADIANLQQSYANLSQREAESRQRIAGLEMGLADSNSRVAAIRSATADICTTTTPGGKVIVPCSELRNPRN